MDSKKHTQKKKSVRLVKIDSRKSGVSRRLESFDDETESVALSEISLRLKSFPGMQTSPKSTHNFCFISLHHSKSKLI